MLARYLYATLARFTDQTTELGLITVYAVHLPERTAMSVFQYLVSYVHKSIDPCGSQLD